MQDPEAHAPAHAAPYPKRGATIHAVEGAILGVDRYGASAPAPKIFEAFGLTVANVTDIGRRVVREGLHGRQGVTLGHGH